MLGFNGTSPGPTLRVRAEDTLHILLKYTLPSELVSTSSRRECGSAVAFTVTVSGKDRHTAGGPDVCMKACECTTF